MSRQPCREFEDLIEDDFFCWDDSFRRWDSDAVKRCSSAPNSPLQLTELREIYPPRSPPRSTTNLDTETYDEEADLFRPLSSELAEPAGIISAQSRLTPGRSVSVTDRGSSPIILLPLVENISYLGEISYLDLQTATQYRTTAPRRTLPRSHSTDDVTVEMLAGGRTSAFGEQNFTIQVEDRFEEASGFTTATEQFVVAENFPSQAPYQSQVQSLTDNFVEPQCFFEPGNYLNFVLTHPGPLEEPSTYLNLEVQPSLSSAWGSATNLRRQDLFRSASTDSILGLLPADSVTTPVAAPPESNEPVASEPPSPPPPLYHADIVSCLHLETAALPAGPRRPMLQRSTSFSSIFNSILEEAESRAVTPQRNNNMESSNHQVIFTPGPSSRYISPGHGQSTYAGISGSLPSSQMSRKRSAEKCNEPSKRAAVGFGLPPYVPPTPSETAHHTQCAQRLARFLKNGRRHASPQRTSDPPSYIPATCSDGKTSILIRLENGNLVEQVTLVMASPQSDSTASACPFPSCSYRCSEQSDLFTHMASHLLSWPTIPACPVCGVALERSAYHSHIVESHITTDEILCESSRRIVSCPVCNEASSPLHTLRHLLTVHYSAASSSKVWADFTPNRWPCPAPNCGKVCNSYERLFRHIINHFYPRESAVGGLMTLPCCACGQKFRNIAQFRSHVLTHVFTFSSPLDQNVANFKCYICHTDISRDVAGLSHVILSHYPRSSAEARKVNYDRKDASARLRKTEKHEAAEALIILRDQKSQLYSAIRGEPMTP